MIRGFFYCSFIPLWEGYDEWAHFAYIDRIATTGKLLVDRHETVSREIEASFRFAPLPWEMRYMVRPALTEDAYWKLSDPERAARMRQLRTVAPEWPHAPEPNGQSIYEALQPPLYYWLLAFPCYLARHTSLVDRVFLLRYLSLIITSSTIPLVYLAARRMVAYRSNAILVVAVVAVMPELFIDVCRVGNECLGIALYSWLTVVCLRIAMDPIPRGTVDGLVHVLRRVR